MMLAALETFGPEGATATEWQKACESIGIPQKTFDRRLAEMLVSGGLVTKDGDGQGAPHRPAKSEPVSVRLVSN